MNKISGLVLALLLSHQIIAQTDPVNLESIQDVPSKTIYDLFIDRDNFLWIASEVGVHRYDGVSFTPFSSPDQSSLGASGLMQDDEGKIWFHNFSGQIFYIENEQTHLLTSFDARRETRFPRISLLKGSLYATSDSGLFVCDTRTLKSEYLTTPGGKRSRVLALAVTKHRVVAYGDDKWFSFKPGNKPEFTILKAAETVVPKRQVTSLHVSAARDTIFQFSNPAGILKKIGLRNDSLFVYEEKRYTEFINTISLTRNGTWLNTQNTTTWSDNPAFVLKDQNISDVTIDHEGNKWFSSLSEGLLVSYKQRARDRILLPYPARDDVVKTMLHHQNKLLLGTQSGIIYTYDYRAKQFTDQFKLPGNLTSIHKLAALADGKILVGTSIHTYKLDLQNKHIEQIPTLNILKQTVNTGDLTFATSASHLVVLLNRKSPALIDSVRKQFLGISQYDHATNSFTYGKRSDAIAYYPEQKSLFVAFRNSLFILNEKGLTPVLFEEKQVYAQALLYHQGKIFIGTTNNGLLVYDQGKITQFSIDSGLLSNSILKLRKNGEQLWIVSFGSIQLFDMSSLKVFDKKNLSVSQNVWTTDLTLIDKNAYLATLDGLFVIKQDENIAPEKISGYLSSIRVNGQMMAGIHEFEPDQNNIQFKIGVPLYFKAKQTYIKYALLTDRDTSWNLTGPGERTITFASLTPGRYTFKAFAVNPELGYSPEPVIYAFEIRHSWWQNKIFQGIVIFLLVCFVLYIVINYFLNKRRFEKILYQQQISIDEERQRISSEIHDDIGSGIFAIKLYSDVARNSRDLKSDIEHISFMINDISEKIREIIWSTNVENDNLADLILYIKFQMVKMFDHTKIAFEVEIPDSIPDIGLSGVTRKNILLLIKEFLHNAIKHSGAAKVTLHIFLENKALEIRVTDNGTGFSVNNIPATSMGLKNVDKRIQKLGGRYTISSQSGTQINMIIPLGN